MSCLVYLPFRSRLRDFRFLILGNWGNVGGSSRVSVICRCQFVLLNNRRGEKSCHNKGWKGDRETRSLLALLSELKTTIIFYLFAKASAQNEDLSRRQSLVTFVIRFGGRRDRRLVICLLARSCSQTNVAWWSNR